MRLPPVTECLDGSPKPGRATKQDAAQAMT